MRVALVRCGRAPLSICERYDWLMDWRSSLLNGADDFLLGHFAIQAAERAFHFAEVADFFTEPHIAICD